MTANLSWKLAPVAALLVLVPGCAADDATTGDDEVRAFGDVLEMLVPLSSLETHTTRSAKVARLKLRGTDQVEEVPRCHQYPIRGRAETVVCRNDKREIVMDGHLSEDVPRWARLRVPRGADRTFLCKKVAEREHSPEIYGGVTGHVCTPKAMDPMEAKSHFATVDDAAIGESPTERVFVPTLWKKAPPETWATWNEAIQRAIPLGEYVGHGPTSAKKCKVRIAPKNDGLEVTIVGLDEAGAETRVHARAELSSAMTFGALRSDDLPQRVANTARNASVILASSETETRTIEYLARNVRIVRYPDAPESVDAGHTAVFVDGNYCQRLSPRLPAW